MIELQQNSADNNRKIAVDILKAIANPARFAAICALAKRQHTVSELMNIVNLAQPAMSNELARLKKAGVIKCNIEGNKRVYYISDQRAAAIVDIFSVGVTK